MGTIIAYCFLASIAGFIGFITGLLVCKPKINESQRLADQYRAKALESLELMKKQASELKYLKEHTEAILYGIKRNCP